MASRFEGTPDPNPQLNTAELTGAQMDEPFVRLVARQIDSLTVDGYRLLGVDEVNHDREHGTTTVLCTAEDGGRHLFMYQPDSDSPVAHLVDEEGM